MRDYGPCGIPYYFINTGQCRKIQDFANTAPALSRICLAFQIRYLHYPVFTSLSNTVPVLGLY